MTRLERLAKKPRLDPMGNTNPPERDKFVSCR